MCYRLWTKHDRMQAFSPNSCTSRCNGNFRKDCRKSKSRLAGKPPVKDVMALLRMARKARAVYLTGVSLVSPGTRCRFCEALGSALGPMRIQLPHILPAFAAGPASKFTSRIASSSPKALRPRRIGGQRSRQPRQSPRDAALATNGRSIALPDHFLRISMNHAVGYG